MFGSASAEEPQAPSIGLRALAATCAGCHGTDGHPVRDAGVPALAGAPMRQTATRLRAFRARARPGEVMDQIAAGYDDAQIDAIAAYFSRQKR